MELFLGVGKDTHVCGTFGRMLWTRGIRNVALLAFQEYRSLGVVVVVVVVHISFNPWLL